MTTVIKSRPILFSAPMVQALIAGRKTVTRRIVTKGHGKKLGLDTVGDMFVTVDGPQWDGTFEGGDIPWCPYGTPGSRLWVREAWTYKNWTDDECAKAGCNDARQHPIETYLDIPTRAIYRASYNDLIGSPGKWRPSIFMPRWASRITLEVLDVRVEQLQYITEEDANKEGFESSYSPAYVSGGEICGPDGIDARDEFRELWDKINGPGSFDANPWIWRVEFKKL